VTRIKRRIFALSKRYERYRERKAKRKRKIGKTDKIALKLRRFYLNSLLGKNFSTCIPVRKGTEIAGVKNTERGLSG